MKNITLQKAQDYLDHLCVHIDSRRVGSPGNRAATDYAEGLLASFGWQTRSQEFDAVDWKDGGASLQAGGQSFQVLASTYALGCDVQAELIAVDSLAALETAPLQGKIVLLHGDITREQIMPKNFVFYNPEEHQHIIQLLEQGQPLALVCATDRNPAVAGGVYPFPLFEDGDFDIPSVYMTGEEGQRLLPLVGQPAALRSDARRLPGTGRNVLALKGSPAAPRVVVSAHIDAKIGTPGAMDNASGVVILLLLAEMLSDYAGSPALEILVLNGEDYYAVPGQMLYLQSCQGRMEEILYNINIDGAGYFQGPSAFSFYDLPAEIEQSIRQVLAQHPGICEGVQWYQSDHSIFIQNGRPAMAVSSNWLTDHMDSQDITHTPKDNPAIVDCARLVEVASALAEMLRRKP